MATNFLADGNGLLWTNTTGIGVKSGAVVVVGNLLGIALTDIAANESGAVAINGIFQCNKVAGNAWNQGVNLLWDVSVAKFDVATASPSSGDIAGAAFAAASAASAATTGAVGFASSIGTVTP